MGTHSTGRPWQPSEPFPAPDAFLNDPVPDEVLASWANLIDPEDPAIYSIARVGLELQCTYGFDLGDPSVVERAIATGRQRYEERQRAARHASRLSDEAAAAAMGSTVVYYMRIGTRVKIGYSTNLPLRLLTIVPEELMVVEPGGYELEQLRHREFWQLRVVGEWFSLESPLTEHIEQLRDLAVATIAGQ